MFNVGTLLFCAFLSLSAVTKGQSILSTPANNSPADTVIAASESLDHKSVYEGDSVAAENLITYAKTLKGIPYRYGCSDPNKGFDCSGFVKYVFNHFKMNVPRSSIGFTTLGKEVDLQQAIPGDIILFTGTDSSIRKVGHVGIVTQVSDTIVFIHSSSGKTPGVIETSLNPHYKKRFIKVIRVLP